MIWVCQKEIERLSKCSPNLFIRLLVLVSKPFRVLYLHFGTGHQDH